MIHFDATKIDSLDKSYRRNLINSVQGVKPVNLIGTKNKDGAENLAIFSSIIHLGANPSLIGFIQRPKSFFAHTYKNILETRFFTVNQVNKSILKKAHLTSARFEKEISEFEICGLESEYKNEFFAPYVQESFVQIGVKFLQEIPIELNGTRLIIGEIQHIFIKENSIDIEGNLNPIENQSVGVNGLESYFEYGELERFPYAKANDILNQQKIN